MLTESPDDRRGILARVQAGTITPEEGLRRLRALAATAATPERAAISFFEPHWEATGSLPDVAAHAGAAAPTSLIIVDRDDRFRRAVSSRHDLGIARPVLIVAGTRFEQVDDLTFRIDLHETADYHEVAERLAAAGVRPHLIVHLLAAGDAPVCADLSDSFHSVFGIMQAFGRLQADAPLRLLAVHTHENGDARPEVEALGGLAVARWLENRRHVCHTIELGDDLTPYDDRVIASLFAENASSPAQIRYADGRRWQQIWTGAERLQPRRPPVHFRDGGVYLVTGGAGGIGLHLACHLAAAHHAKLMLVGRSRLDETRLARLQDLGGDWWYEPADVSRDEEAARIVAATRARFGRIDGVVHAAGVATPGALLTERRADDALAVLAPKVRGVRALDAATRDEPLDFMVLMASISGHALSPGLADYAYANQFLDAFAHWRSAQAAKGLRSGPTIAIDWPYWAEGGMPLPASAQQRMKVETGLDPLTTADAIGAWQAIMSAAPVQCMPVAGSREAFARYLSKLRAAPAVGPAFSRAAAPAVVASSTVAPAASHDVASAVTAWLADTLAHVVGVPAAEVDPSVPFPEYGFNSIAMTELTAAVEKLVGKVPQTLLLDHQTVGAVSAYLIRHCGEALERRFGAASAPPIVAVPPIVAARPEPSPRRGAEPPRRDDAIAVVGLSGRFAGAGNIRQLWDNLKSGRRTITDTPADRWDWRRWHDARPESAEAGRIYCQWGGFLADVDMFDPLAFQMTPAEAKHLHPEERLLLESAWHAIEDAGYSHRALDGRAVGVFVGVNGLSYPWLGVDRWVERADVSLDASYFALPNRVSHFFNLRGPSTSFDTGCSSSLVALDAACRAIRAGQCDGALVGGVNLYLHPARYWTLCHARLASTRDRRGLFERGGDGFVPGEGVAMAMLKRLADAERDGDHVYGVVRATVAGHKGRSSAFLLPSPLSQQALLQRALNEAGRTVGEVSYIEMQGIGAEIADLSEWQAFSDTFRAGTARRAFCAVGSIEPNIGHLEAASGMAQLVKGLLQMDRGEVAPTIVAPDRTDGITLDDSPFYFQETLTPWRDGCALVGSVAAGGTQAFAVLEPHAASRQRGRTAPHEERDELIVLSARSAEQLRRAQQDLLSALDSDEARDVTLADLAFTLQAGREPFSHRFAVVVRGRGQLVEALRASLDGRDGESDGRVCHVERAHAATALEPRDAVEIYERRNVGLAMERWLENAALDWRRMPDAGARRRISAPGHPFERRRCWLYDTVPEPAREIAAAAAADTPASVVADYYDRYATPVDADAEIFLLFAPFPEPVAGFSWLRTFLEPARNREHYELMVARQREMKDVLYRLVDFSRVRRVMDIGCGLGTDLIQLARRHPHLQADGFTISPKQAAAARQRVESAGLAGRVSIRCADSTKEPFPNRCDLVIGFEVLFHIENKRGVFENVRDHLEHGGQMVLADGIATTVTEIHMPHLGQFTSTGPQLAELLMRSGLHVVHVVDASREIANFLDDPDLEANLAYARSVHPDAADTEPHHRGWASFGKALAEGIVRYLLFTIERAPAETDPRQLLAANLARIEHAQPYAEARRGAPSLERPIAVLSADVEQRVVALAARVFDMTPGELDRAAPFAEYGVTSLMGVRFVDAVNRDLGLSITMPDFFRFPSLRALSDHIASLGPVVPAVTVTPPEPAPHPIAAAGDIAVIGMAGRFPGADNLERLWQNLERGVDSVTDAPPGRPEFAGATARGGFIDGIDLFDPAFFNISPSEAEVMDPQHRLFLEEAWKALEDAGYVGRTPKGMRCGVVVGHGGNEYAALLFGRHDPAQLSQVMTGNSSSLVAGRLAYCLNLSGPAIAIDTACSSSLVAVHLACQCLRNGEAELMVAGGVALNVTSSPFTLLGHTGTISRAGRCRPFDDSADGFLLGEGAAAVVLKPLAKALEDGDRVYGLIKGSGVNQDGKTNGMIAPNLEAQKSLEIFVYERCGINPETITYVEAHGTGTRLGDPIEITALTEAFRRFTRRKQFCAVGSIKSNIGHASYAAGIAGLIKVLLSMGRRQIPATVHLERENRHISFANSPFYVNRTLVDWPATDGVPLRAAVSSFGMSGTNCHLVVEQAPPIAVRDAGPSGARVFPVSAADSDARARCVEGLLAAVPADVNLGDLAFTLQIARRELRHRVAVVASTLEELRAGWTAFLAGAGHSGVHAGGVEPTRARLAMSGEEVRRKVEAGGLSEIASAWAQGADVEWLAFHADSKPRRVRLPNTPLSPKRHWVPAEIRPDAVALFGPRHAAPVALAPPTPAPSVWLFIPEWQRRPVSASRTADNGTVLLIDIPLGVQAAIGRTLSASGRDSHVANIDLAAAVDPQRMLRLIERLNRRPLRVVFGTGGDADAVLRASFHFLQGVLGNAKAPPARTLFWLQDANGDPLCEALSAFGASLPHLLPSVQVRTLSVAESLGNDAVARALVDDLFDADRRALEARIQDGVREVRSFRRASPPSVDGGGVVRRDGVWLLTGGAGGLGRLFARHLMERYHAAVILTGRSPLDADRRARLEQLSEDPRRLSYVQADVTDLDAMRDLVARIERERGGLTGVMHVAADIDNVPFLAKDWPSFEGRLGPKVRGTRVLDEATRACRLDAFVMFSSISSIVGDFGQCDYSIGNRFLDGFARTRSRWRAEGRRTGVTVSINWPAWRGGRMGLGDEAEALYVKTSGMPLLTEADGLPAFERALASGEPQVVVLSGDVARLERMVDFWTPVVQSDASSPRAVVRTEVRTDVRAESMRPASRTAAPSAGVLTEVRQMAAALLKMEAGALAVDRNLGDFGFDSIGLRTLAERISRRYEGDVAPAVFYARPTLKGLAEWLVAEGIAPPDADSEPVPAPPPVVAPPASATPVAPPLGTARVEGPRPDAAAGEREHEPIAIIGLHGQFADAADAAAYWKHIERGEISVRQCPPERSHEWLSEFWAGFLPSVDRFDADFFNISPREAELMDPQQRLLLETAWKAFEDAAWPPDRAAGSRTAVFIGNDRIDYADVLRQHATPMDPYVVSGLHPAMLANRLSGFFDLRGPSEVVNGGCCSATLALHRAVRALRGGECDAALVGGVNVIASPGAFAAMVHIGGLSPTQVARPFDAEADGSVRGEGVAVVLLKPLREARADGDRIWGVIRGTAAVHGGRGQGLTAPNIDAQTQAMVEAWRDAGVDPRTVQYIEAQGTGSELADAIELHAYVSAYRRLLDERGVDAPAGATCGVGAAKGNIGHLESASGMAALVKVLMALRHGVMPAMTNFRQLNRQVRLDGTPFFIVRANRAWPDSGVSPTKRAAIHSYGLGGICAHVVLESFEAHAPTSPGADGADRLLFLSARDDEALEARANELAAFLEPPHDPPRLADVAFTLMDGRASLPARLAMVANSVPDAIRQLRGYASGEGGPDVIAATMQPGSRGLSALLGSPEAESFARLLAEGGKLRELGQFWVAGGDVRPIVPLLFADARRIALPVYSFRPRRHWVDGSARVSADAPDAASAVALLDTDLPDGDDVLADLTRMLGELLKRDPRELAPAVRLADYGVDSFITTAFLRSVQRRYGAGISLAAVVKHPTLRELSEYVRREGAPPPLRSESRVAMRPAAGPLPADDRTGSELLPINPRGIHQPSFWFHGAPGLAQLYNPLSAALGPDYPMYAFQARGVDGVAAPFTRMRDMVACYLDSIRRIQPGGPYILGGYSFGGLVAFAAAQALASEGHEIGHLVMFDTYPPSLLSTAAAGIVDRSSGLRELHRMMNAMMFFSAELDVPVWKAVTLDDLRRLPSAGQLAELARLVKSRVKTALTLDEVYAFLNGVDAVTCITERMVEEYELTPYDASDVLYFKTGRFIDADSPFAITDVDPKEIGVDIEKLLALQQVDYTAEWRAIVRRRLSVVEYGCDHMSLFVEPVLSEVCGHLRRLLDRPQPTLRRQRAGPSHPSRRRARPGRRLQ